MNISGIYIVICLLAFILACVSYNLLVLFQQRDLLDSIVAELRKGDLTPLEDLDHRS